MTAQDDWRIVPAFGCIVRESGGVLFTCPLDTDGNVDKFDWTEVTDPAPGFVRAARAVLPACEEEAPCES